MLTIVPFQLFYSNSLPFPQMSTLVTFQLLNSNTVDTVLTLVHSVIDSTLQLSPR